jgi:hypothetical protein
MAVDAGLRIERVEAVADERQAVGGAPEADEPGGVAWQRDDLEPGDLVALVDGAGDGDRPAVPHPQQVREDGLGVGLELFEVEVAHAAVALGVLAVVGMAQDRHVEVGRDAAVVGMPVAEQDPRDAAQRRAGGGDGARHRLDPRVVEHHAVAVAYEVDVHRLAGEAAAHDPYAVGDGLGAGGDAPLDARGQVEGLGHARLGRGAQRGQRAELARELGAVHVGVDRRDAPVAHAHEVDALDVDPSAVGLEAQEAARPGEGGVGAPADRRPVVLGHDVEDVEAPVREGVEELGEERDHLVAADRAGHAVDLDGRVGRVVALLGVALGAPERLEVLAHDALRLGHRLTLRIRWGRR